jgi:hypothetical protein
MAIINGLPITPKTMQLLTNNFNDKSPHVRTICQKVALNAFKRSPKKIDLHLVEKVLFIGLGDASKEVRNVSKELLQYFGSFFPQNLIK